jgi:hypothetical protein
MTRNSDHYSSLLVSAEARWAGLRSILPVRGEAWFVGLPEHTGSGCASGSKMLQLLTRAAKAYPAMFYAVERIEERHGAAVLRLRPLEVFEDDIEGSGLGDLRKALGRRAEVCGMRVVACINAMCGEAAIHGMPLDRDPSLLSSSRLASMLDELELLRASSAGQRESARRL